MTVLVPLLVVLPVAASGISMALWREVRLQQVLGLGVLSTGAAVTGVLLSHARHGPVVVRLGGWPAEVGITLVADLLSTLLLLVSQLTLLAVFLFAVGQPRGDKGAYYFHPLYLLLAAGVSAAFLTGDLFNLFVAFEVMLCVSYVLITLGGRSEQVRSGMTYVVINLVASSILVVAVGLTYAATGSLNMADVAVRLEDVPPGVRNMLSAMFFVSFGIKAAIFPLFFWLPDSYPTAPVTVTAVFAGLLTKLGVYAIIRTQTLLFPQEEAGPAVLIVAAATMVVGVLGAIAQVDMKRILSFHIVSQIGYMLFGLGLHTAAGLTGAVFFTMHQIPVKAALFLVAGLVETTMGTAALSHLGGLMRRSPATAVLFLLAALSLAGIPPLSGFFGKLLLVRAGIEAEAWLVTGVSLAVSLLTLLSMTKIWAGAFWGEDREPLPLPAEYGERLPRAPALMMTGTAALVGVTVLLGLLAEPLWTLCQSAAAELIDPRASYVRAVLGR